MVKIYTTGTKETTMDTYAWMFTFTEQMFNDFDRLELFIFLHIPVLVPFCLQELLKL